MRELAGLAARASLGPPVSPPGPSTTCCCPQGKKFNKGGDEGTHRLGKRRAALALAIRLCQACSDHDASPLELYKSVGPLLNPAMQGCHPRHHWSRLQAVCIRRKKVASHHHSTS